MAKLWVRKVISGSGATSGTQLNETTIYNNQRETSGQITLEQKVTVVATHLMLIHDSDDILTFRLAVVDEAVTLTYGTLATDDDQYKGIYPFARGPVYFSPRRLISVPTESHLDMQVIKENGSVNTTYRGYVQLLLQTSL